LLLAFFAAWVGHAYLWTSLLNFVYARPYSKDFLKLWRLVTGLIIFGFLLVIAAAFDTVYQPNWEGDPGVELLLLNLYLVLCLAFGGLIYPAVNLYRLLRKSPAALLSETTAMLDLWKELGGQAIGDGHWAKLARLP